MARRVHLFFRFLSGSQSVGGCGGKTNDARLLGKLREFEKLEKVRSAKKYFKLTKKFKFEEKTFVRKGESHTGEKLDKC